MKETPLKRAFAPFSPLALCALFLGPLLACALLTAAPTAFAADARCQHETLQGTVETDGTLAFLDQRVYTLDPDQTVLQIKLPIFRYGATLKVESVRSAPCDDSGTPTGEWEALVATPFQLTWRDGLPKDAVSTADTTTDQRIPAPLSYGFDDANQILYLFLNPGQTSRAIVIDCRAVDAAELYEDVAQLNWTLVPADSLTPIERLQATIALPIPGLDQPTHTAGEDAIHAWGHGPASMTVEVDAAGSVLCDVGRIIPGQYCETRVLFPASWLTSADAELRSQHEGALMLDTAIEQESHWSDQWRVRRTITTLATLALLIASAVLLGAALIAYLLFGREYRRRYTSASRWQDPAAGLSPVVVNRLLRWNHSDPSDVALSAGRLLGEGALAIGMTNEGDAANGAGGPKTAAAGARAGSTAQTPAPTRLICTAQTLEAAAEPVETATLHLLFADLPAIVSSPESVHHRPTLDVAALEQAAAQDRNVITALRGAWDRWESAVRASYNPGEYFESRGRTLQAVFGVIAIIWLIVGIVAGVTLGTWPSAVGAMLAALCIAMLAARMPRRTLIGDAIVGRFHQLADQFRAYGRGDSVPAEGEDSDDSPQAPSEPPATILPYAVIADAIDPVIRQLIGRHRDQAVRLPRTAQQQRFDGIVAYYGAPSPGARSLVERLTALFTLVLRKS